METPVLQVAKAWREALTKHGELAENMVVGAAGVDIVFFDFESAFVPVEPVQDIGCLAFGGPDRQDVEMAVLIGNPGVELAARVPAVVGVDIGSSSPTSIFL